MKALLLAYFTAPLLSPESMLVRRMLHATASPGLSWDLVTVNPLFAYGAKDHGSGIALETLEHPPHICRVPSAEYALAPLYALFPRLRLLPDTRRGWMPFAVRAAAKRLRQEPRDVLVTWAQPYSSHLAGLALKKRFPQLPWVAYFGDPWGGNPYIDTIPPSCVVQEGEVLQRAERIIVNTRAVREDMIRRHALKETEKIHVIPHSCDHAWLEKTPPGEPREEQEKRQRTGQKPCTLTYAGNFYGKRTPEPLLEGLRFVPSGSKRSLEVRFVGKFPESSKDTVRELEPLVRLYGQKSYGETRKLLDASDMLLLIDAPLAESMFLPSKLVDYLALRKPILAITPRGGASWQALEGLEHVYRMDPGETEKIGMFLAQLARGEIAFSEAPSVPSAFLPETVGEQWRRVLEEARKALLREKS